MATTLKYAGVEEVRVAILDGGFPAWKESFQVTTEVPEPEPAGEFRGEPLVHRRHGLRSRRLPQAG